MLSNSQTEKNRIMLSLVSFLSLLPSFVSQAIQFTIKIFQPEAGDLLSISLSIMLLCNIGIAQFVEELCLIIFCDDFGKLIRKQCSCCIGSSSSSTPVTPITVSTSSNHQRNVNNNGNPAAHRIRTIAV